MKRYQLGWLCCPLRLYSMHYTDGTAYHIIPCNPKFFVTKPASREAPQYVTVDERQKRISQTSPQLSTGLPP